MSSTEWTPIWSFRTKNLVVLGSVAPEEMDPEDSFEFPDDIEAVRNGSVEWFKVRVAIFKNGNCIGADYLDGCAYKTVSEFFTGHRDKDPMNRNSSVMRAKNGNNAVICHYFPGMVQQAIAEARATLS